MRPVERTRAAWKRIELWLEGNQAVEILEDLNPPATARQIQYLERWVGNILPNEVRSLYLLRNGQTGYGRGVFEGYKFLSLEAIRAVWQIWRRIVRQLPVRDLRSNAQRGIRSEWLSAAWIPFAASEGGDHYCIDLSPAKEGTHGQIILVYHDQPERLRVAAGLTAWLEKYADELEGGRYQFLADMGEIVSVRDERMMRAAAAPDTPSDARETSRGGRAKRTRRT